MKIEMFKIGVSDLKRRTSVSLLVDKPDFIQTIKRLREKWAIEKLFEPQQHNLLLEHICGSNKDLAKWDEFNADIEAVRKSFNRTPNFGKVIKYALAFTKIPDTAYRSTYFKAVNSSEYPDDTEYAIIVTPHSTNTEVITELKEFKQMVHDQIEHRKSKAALDKAVEKYKYEPGPVYKDFDSIVTLDRTRFWYWEMHSDILNGDSTIAPKSYKDVQAKCSKRGKHDTDEEYMSCPYCNIDDVNSIQHLLPKYKKRLEIS